ncbi:MAG TPA: glycosyltransferase family 4 protein [Fimbriimonas sp.]
MPSRDPLSILQICSASEAVYGAAQSLMTLAQGQRDQGDRVEFVTFRGKRFGRQVREARFRVHEVRVRSKIDILAVLQMRRTIRQGNFDLVHTHLSTSSVNGCLAARLAKVPALATVHGMSGKLSYVFADHLIGVSQNVKSHLIDQGVPANKVSVVYNGLKFEPAKPTGISARRSFEVLGTPVIGTVARVTELKGIEYGIESIARLIDDFPHIQYVVAGDGDRLEACRGHARDLGIERHVTFLGYQKDVASVLSTMDLFLFPSLKEAMGIALVEAMAAGLPIVSTTVGGIPEVVTPDCGILVPPRSAEALAEAAREVLVNDLKSLSMSESARRRAETMFSVPAMVKGVDQVYRTMMREMRGRRFSSKEEASVSQPPRFVP